jgi:perosamine synthetase
MVTAVVASELGKTKEDVMNALAARRIDTRPFFDPLSSLGAYAELPESRAAARRNRVAYALAPYGVNLPSALSLTADDVAFVCESLADVLSVA